MNILQLALANWRQGPQTQRFPNREAPAANFRGHVVNDSSRCITCGICSEVCVSAAISVVTTDDSGTWIYDPAACTFCGACVEHCPVDALTQDADRGPACGRPGDQAVTVKVTFPACTECGQPATPYSAALLRAALPHAATELSDRGRLCPDCRYKASAQVLKRAYEGPSGTERHDDGR